MACDYCKNKAKNKPLIESKDKDEGVIVGIQKRDDKAYLYSFGWFDAMCGIRALDVKINYCPMCGARLSKVVEDGA